MDRKYVNRTLSSPNRPNFIVWCKWESSKGVFEIYGMTISLYYKL